MEVAVPGARSGVPGCGECDGAYLWSVAGAGGKEDEGYDRRTSRARDRFRHRPVRCAHRGAGDEPSARAAGGSGDSCGADPYATRAAAFRSCACAAAPRRVRGRGYRRARCRGRQDRGRGQRRLAASRRGGLHPLGRDRGRRRGRGHRFGRVHRRHMDARRALRELPDLAAGDGRRVHRRQNRHQHAAGQEPGRLVLHAGRRARRRADAGLAAQRHLHRRPRRGGQVRVHHGRGDPADPGIPCRGAARVRRRDLPGIAAEGRGVRTDRTHGARQGAPRLLRLEGAGAARVPQLRAHPRSCHRADRALQVAARQRGGRRHGVRGGAVEPARVYRPRSGGLSPLAARSVGLADLMGRRRVVRRAGADAPG